MNGSSYLVIVQLTHLHGLVYNALSCKCRISMDGNSTDLTSFLVAKVVLFRPDSSLQHGVYSLQMAGVGQKGDSDLFAVFIGSLVGAAKVVLDVSRVAPHVLFVFVVDYLLSLEFVKYDLQRFSDDVS